MEYYKNSVVRGNDELLKGIVMIFSQKVKS